MASRHVLERRNILSLGIAYVIAFFRQQPQPTYDGPDTFDGTDAEGFPGGDERMTEGDKIAKQNEAFDIAEAMAPPRDVSAECGNTGDFDETKMRLVVDRETFQVTAKPKRVRPPKSKPLTAADIFIGGIYVPKRGNNRTPNLQVTKVLGPNTTGGMLVEYRKTDGSDEFVASIERFLSLVARRVTP